ncbi:hypothetical protein TWF106_004632 [Orbilia oligospora]|uniref:Inhibitor I9 domain-containing protein n=1 Tax=Orbilia oligospora TaxID=2813651 RepID=A0A6G1LTM2_ORBOL|nr:hypothetical protein TWF788_002812 [Orbilia oligospora]KAF3204585.1 hypothetical protein TWF679_009786 [Orbilia oligospora]KAF3210275.1 hypothetical protein TWF191_011234 [Orbilia oligospora]KAF3223986.1 hypothetical protein TWF106_004632 [Orbilia oligospora]KAF3234116.1 hypothetical protein TWF192_001676 [Orbilia oligospora]
MPTTYIITVKDGENKDEVKQHVIDSGAKITHDYSLIHAFAAEFPDDAVTTFQSHPKVAAWEKDQEVKTQVN